MTRICLISDTHNRHDELDIPPCDLLIHSGDATNFGYEDEFLNFNQWGEKIKKDGLVKKIWYTPGNHDQLFVKNRDKAESILTSFDHIVIHGCAFPFGLKIWGCSYVPPHGPGAFMVEENKLYFIYNQIPVNLDIVICHGPPRGILDEFRYEKCGSIQLAEVIKIKKPRYFICGHIHSGRGVHVENDTTFINCATPGISNQIHPPIILDI